MRILSTNILINSHTNEAMWHKVLMAPQPFGYGFLGQKGLPQVVMASALLIFKNKKLLSLSFEILVLINSDSA